MFSASFESFFSRPCVAMAAIVSIPLRFAYVERNAEWIL